MKNVAASISLQSVSIQGIVSSPIELYNRAVMFTIKRKYGVVPRR